MKANPRYRRTSDEISVEDTNWLHLGQLRALVAMADERRWSDDALISHGRGDDHLYRSDIRVARRIVIEGNDPAEPTP